MFGRPHSIISERKTGSLPDLHVPPKYLTKKNDTTEFREKLSAKLAGMQQERKEIGTRIAEIRENIKQKEEQEHYIVTDREDKKKLRTLIPVYRDIRDLKRELLKLHVKNQELDNDIRRVSSQEKAISSRQEVFKLLNIPTVSERPSLISPSTTLRRITSGKSFGGLQSSSLMTLIEKPVDKKRLNMVRLGLSRDWVGVSLDARINFSRKEKIFPPLENIVKGQKQHILDKTSRWKEVSQNRKDIEQMILNNRIEKKMNKEAGIFTTARNSLYPFSDGKSFHKLDFSRINSSTKRGKPVGSQGSLAELQGLHSHKSSYNILSFF